MTTNAPLVLESVVVGPVMLGTRNVVICPWHQEASGSLIVDTGNDKPGAWCLGCGAKARVVVTGARPEGVMVKLIPTDLPRRADALTKVKA